MAVYFSNYIKIGCLFYAVKYLSNNKLINRIIYYLFKYDLIINIFRFKLIMYSFLFINKYFCKYHLNSLIFIKFMTQHKYFIYNLIKL